MATMTGQSSNNQINRRLREGLRHQTGGNPQAAREIYRGVLRQAPDHPDALHLLGLCALAQGELEEAVMLLRQAVSHQPDNPTFHNNLGTALRQKEELAEAAACFQSALSQRPSYETALANLAQTQAELGADEPAIASYRRLLVSAPDNADAHNNLGVVLLRRGAHAAAAGHFRRALSLRPGFAGAALNLGDAVAAQGALSEAAEYYRRALDDDPGLSPAYGKLADAVLRLGRFAEAEAILRDALAKQGESFDLLCLLGRSLHKGGRSTEAATAYKRAIALGPSEDKARGNQQDAGDERPHDPSAQAAGLAVAHGELAAVLQGLGDMTGAEDAYRAGLRIDPNNSRINNSLGILLSQSGRAGEAEWHYRQAIEIDPQFPEAHNNLGSLLQSLGRFHDAETAFKRALSVKPAYATALANIAYGRKITSHDSVVADIRAALDRPGLSDRERVGLHLSLGKCLDDLRRFDQAFEQFRLGNEINKKEHPFEETALCAWIDALRRSFDAAFFANRPARSGVSDKPVFILGMPRSGTTLVEQILASHSGVFGAGELPFFYNLENALCSAPGNTLPYPDSTAALTPERVQKEAAAYLAALPPEATAARRVTDKMPHNFLRIGLISLLFPNARIVCCRRDSLDVCLSCYFQNFEAVQPYTYDLWALGRFYRYHERLMAHWQEVLGGSIFTLAYEELLEDPEGVSRALIDFCGLSWENSCLEFHATTRSVQTASIWQVRQPLYKSARGRWKSYEAHLGPLKDALVQPLPGV